jgi:hypothetical protein
MSRLSAFFFPLALLAGCNPSTRGSSLPDAAGAVTDGGVCGEVRFIAFDAMDAIFYIDRFTVDGAGRITDEYVYQSPGPDGQWNNADDVVANWGHLDYDAAGRVRAWAAYTSPGADGLWGTADDVQSQAATYGYDAQSHMSTVMDYSAPGPDGSWGTADDTVHARYVNQYDSAGNVIWQLLIGDPGPDLLWGTSDDVVVVEDRALLRGTYDVYHYPTKVFTNMVPGPDGKWATADDVTVHLRTFECTDRVLIKEYSGPGPDAMWDSPDDVLMNQHSIKIVGPSCGLDPCSSPTPIL